MFLSYLGYFLGCIIISLLYFDMLFKAYLNPETNMLYIEAYQCLDFCFQAFFPFIFAW